MLCLRQIELAQLEQRTRAIFRGFPLEIFRSPHVDLLMGTTAFKLRTLARTVAEAVSRVSSDDSPKAQTAKRIASRTSSRTTCKVRGGDNTSAGATIVPPRHPCGESSPVGPRGRPLVSGRASRAVRGRTGAANKGTLTLSRHLHAPFEQEEEPHAHLALPHTRIAG